MAAGELNAETLQALQDQGGTEQDSKLNPDVTVEPGKEVIKESTELDPLEFKPAGDTQDIESKILESKSKADSVQDTASVDARMKEAGLDPDVIAKQIIEHGDVPADVIAKAKETLDPDLVDTHVKNMRLQLELAKNKKQETDTKQVDAKKAVNDMNKFIFDSVGGEAKFKVLGDTLKAKIPANDLAMLNAKIGSGNKLLVEEGMKAAIDTYNKVRGMGGKLMPGDAQGVQHESVPRINKEEFRTILKSEKYKTDPVYAAKMDAARMATKANDKKAYGPGQYYGFTQNGRYEL